LAKIDYTNRDYEGFRNMMIDHLKQNMPEYTDHSESDAGIVLIEALAKALDALSYYNDRTANEIFLETLYEKQNALKLTSYLGYDSRSRESTEFMQVFEIEPQSEEVIVERGTKIATDPSSGEEKIVFELKEDLTIPEGETGLETDVDGNYIHEVPIIQGESVSEEELGTSDGSPYQKFELDRTPVVSDSVEVYVNEGYGYKRWEQVDSFINMNSDSEVYRLQEEENGKIRIEFGSGLSGKIPAKSRHPILANYRVGGGQQGNVGVNTITKMPSKPSFVKETFNPQEPYKLGIDGETVEELGINAPASMRTQNRVVKLSDYEDEAIQMNEVRLASCVEGTEFRDIDLHVLPYGAETLTEDKRDYIHEEIDSKALIGYSLYVKDPVYVSIDINVYVRVLDNYEQEPVQSVVEELIDEYFELGNKGFGEDFIESDLSSEIMKLTGVRAVDVSTVNANPDIDDTEIVRLGTSNLTMEGGLV
jgi:hypothetical protein